MATSYPGGIDAFTNPTATDSLASATVPHATQHANANDAIEAIETELGTNPKGSSASVKARLDTLDTTVAGKAATVHTHAQSDVTNLTTDLAAKAPLASPTFTGTVTIPDVGLGAWTSYTPTWSGITLGDGAVSGEYVRIGKTVHFKARILFGSTTTVTGSVSVSLPLTAADSGTYPVIMQAVAVDAGNTYVQLLTYGNNVYAVNTAGTYSALADLSSTVPMTWAVDDVIAVSGTYETSA